MLPVSTAGLVVEGLKDAPAIIQAVGFLLSMFKHGPSRDEAAAHLQNIIASVPKPDVETGKLLTMPSAAAAPGSNSQTSTVDNLSGEHVAVLAAGETFGEQFTTLTAQGPQDLQSQLIEFERALGQIFEVIGYRVPNFDQVMGKDREVIGALAGGTGDVQHDRMALISQVGSPDAGASVDINVQVKVERLINQKQSGWLSFQQVLEGGF